MAHEQVFSGGNDGTDPIDVDPDERDSLRVLRCAGYEELADRELVGTDGSPVVRDGVAVRARHFLSICRAEAWPFLEPMVKTIETDPRTDAAQEQIGMLQVSIGPWLGIEMNPGA